MAFPLSYRKVCETETESGVLGRNMSKRKLAYKENSSSNNFLTPVIWHTLILVHTPAPVPGTWTDGSQMFLSELQSKWIREAEVQRPEAS